MFNHSIKIYRTESSWVASSPQLNVESRTAKTGVGSSPQEAIASFYMENAKFFGCESVHYAMHDPLTCSFINSHSISNTKLL